MFPPSVPVKPSSQTALLHQTVLVHPVRIKPCPVFIAQTKLHLHFEFKPNLMPIPILKNLDDDFGLSCIKSWSFTSFAVVLLLVSRSYTYSRA